MSKPSISEAAAEVILKQVEEALSERFGEGMVVDVTVDDEVSRLLVKASATSDPELAEGYRELARMKQEQPR